MGFSCARTGSGGAGRLQAIYVGEKRRLESALAVRAWNTVVYDFALTKNGTFAVCRTRRSPLPRLLRHDVPHPRAGCRHLTPSRRADPMRWPMARKRDALGNIARPVRPNDARTGTRREIRAKLNALLSENAHPSANSQMTTRTWPLVQPAARVHCDASRRDIGGFELADVVLTRRTDSPQDPIRPCCILPNCHGS